MVTKKKKKKVFDLLVSGNFLNTTQELELLDSLLTKKSASPVFEITKLFYTTRMRKLASFTEIEKSHRIIKTKYNLGDNLDILTSQAENYFSHHKFKEALQVTEKFDFLLICLFSRPFLFLFFSFFLFFSLFFFFLFSFFFFFFF